MTTPCCLVQWSITDYIHSLNWCTFFNRYIALLYRYDHPVLLHVYNGVLLPLFIASIETPIAWSNSTVGTPSFRGSSTVLVSHFCAALCNRVKVFASIAITGGSVSVSGWAIPLRSLCTLSTSAASLKLSPSLVSWICLSILRSNFRSLVPQLQQVLIYPPLNSSEVNQLAANPPISNPCLTLIESNLAPGQPRWRLDVCITRIITYGSVSGRSTYVKRCLYAPSNKPWSPKWLPGFLGYHASRTGFLDFLFSFWYIIPSVISISYRFLPWKGSYRGYWIVQCRPRVSVR